MSLFRKELGQKGENAVCGILKKRGFRLLAKNYTIRGGEIDLIMEKGEKIIFLEVKTRSGKEFGEALESITPKKKNALIRTAQVFMQEKSLEDRDVAFWGAAVYVDEKLKTKKVEIVEDIFL